MSSTLKTLMPLLFLTLIFSTTLEATPTLSHRHKINIYKVLKTNGNFKTLHRLFKATETGDAINNALTDTNSNSRRITVFAPTDQAFTNLNSATLPRMSCMQKVELARLHVVPTAYNTTTLRKTHGSIPTLSRNRHSGHRVNLKVTSRNNQTYASIGTVKARVVKQLTKSPFLAVFQVDKVLFSPERITKVPLNKKHETNIYNILKRNGSHHKTFISLLKETDLKSSMRTNESQHVTIFAPTDLAFEKLKGGLGNLSCIRKAVVAMNHVVVGLYDLASLRTVREAVASEAMDGEGRLRLKFRVRDKAVHVSSGVVEARVEDVGLAVGPTVVVFEVDKVLLPRGFDKSGGWGWDTGKSPAPATSGGGGRGMGLGFSVGLVVLLCLM